MKTLILWFVFNLMTLASQVGFLIHRRRKRRLQQIACFQLAQPVLDGGDDRLDFCDEHRPALLERARGVDRPEGLEGRLIDLSRGEARDVIGEIRPLEFAAVGAQALAPFFQKRLITVVLIVDLFKLRRAVQEPGGVVRRRARAFVGPGRPA